MSKTISARERVGERLSLQYREAFPIRDMATSAQLAVSKLLGNMLGQFRARDQARTSGLAVPNRVGPTHQRNPVRAPIEIAFGLRQFANATRSVPGGSSRGDPSHLVLKATDSGMPDNDSILSVSVS
jgi:hypothetical protein